MKLILPVETIFSHRQPQHSFTLPFASLAPARFFIGKKEPHHSYQAQWGGYLECIYHGASFPERTGLSA
jgi:hypothetical protein